MLNLIFDMDGTIIDSNNAIVCAVNELRSRVFLPPLDRHEIVSTMNDPSKDFQKIIYHNKPVGETQSVFAKHYEKNVVLFEGVKELLAWAKNDGHFLAMATNATRETATAILGKLGVLKAFDKLVCVSDGYPSKPDSAMVEAILKDSPFKNSVFIGDSDKDYECAKNASLPFIMVKWYEDYEVNSEATLKESLKNYILKDKNGLF